MNFKAVLALPKTAPFAQTYKSIAFIWIVWSTLYVYLCPYLKSLTYWYPLISKEKEPYQIPSSRYLHNFLKCSTSICFEDINLFWGCIQGRPQNISLSALKSYYFLSWGKSMTENFWISWFDRKSVCIPPMQASWQDYRYQVHSRFLNKSRYICGVSGFCFDRISHILFVWSIERQNIMKGCSRTETFLRTISTWKSCSFKVQLIC